MTLKPDTQPIAVSAATKERFDAACNDFSMDPDVMINWLLGLIPRLFVAGQGGIVVQQSQPSQPAFSSIVYDPDAPPSTPPRTLKVFEDDEPGSNPIIVLESDKFFIKPTVIGPYMHRIARVYQQQEQDQEKPRWQHDDWLDLGGTGFKIK